MLENTGVLRRADKRMLIERITTIKIFKELVVTHPILLNFWSVAAFNLIIFQIFISTSIASMIIRNQKYGWLLAKKSY